MHHAMGFTTFRENLDLEDISLSEVLRREEMEAEPYLDVFQDGSNIFQQSRRSPGPVSFVEGTTPLGQDYGERELPKAFFVFDSPPSSPTGSTSSAQVVPVPDKPKSSGKRRIPRQSPQTTVKKGRKGCCSKWSDGERVMVSGLVLDEFCCRHSLKPCANEKAATNSESFVWIEIHKKYNIARARVGILTGKFLPERSNGAIRKEWKKLGEIARKECIENNGNEDYVPKTKIWHRVWDVELNKENILTCSQQTFEKKINGPGFEYDPPVFYGEMKREQ